jgi:hypothetical protein
MLGSNAVRDADPGSPVQSDAHTSHDSTDAAWVAHQDVGTCDVAIGRGRCGRGGGRRGWPAVDAGKLCARRTCTGFCTMTFLCACSDPQIRNGLTNGQGERCSARHESLAASLPARRRNCLAGTAGAVGGALVSVACLPPLTLSAIHRHEQHLHAQRGVVVDSTKWWVIAHRIDFRQQLDLSRHQPCFHSHSPSSELQAG